MCLVMTTVAGCFWGQAPRDAAAAREGKTDKWLQCAIPRTCPCQQTDGMGATFSRAGTQISAIHLQLPARSAEHWAGQVSLCCSTGESSVTEWAGWDTAIESERLGTSHSGFWLQPARGQGVGQEMGSVRKGHLPLRRGCESWGQPCASAPPELSSGSYLMHGMHF